MRDSLIFGSTAVKHWFSDYREPKDLDIISKSPVNITSTKRIEVHFTNAFNYLLANNIDNNYVDPNYLYTIKVSHAAWDINWDKTMHDVVFLKEKGCILNKHFYKLLINDWQLLHGKKKVKLQGNSESFFNINKNHDQLHQLVKHYDKPMYQIIGACKENVAIDKKLWTNLNHSDKVKCVVEEAFVFAIERFNKYPAKIAYIKALKNLVTSATKGDFNLFIIDNFKEIVYYDISKLKEVLNEQKRNN